jgi:hypothetical protein
LKDTHTQVASARDTALAQANQLTQRVTELTHIETQHQTGQKQLADLASKYSGHLRTQLLSHGLQETTLKDQPLEALEAMAIAAAQLRPPTQGNPVPGAVSGNPPAGATQTGVNPPGGDTNNGAGAHAGNPFAAELAMIDRARNRS